MKDPILFEENELESMEKDVSDLEDLGDSPHVVKVLKYYKVSMPNIGEDIIKSISDGFDSAINKGIKIPEIKIPPLPEIVVKVPDIVVPEPKVTVNVPAPIVTVQPQEEVSVKGLPDFMKQVVERLDRKVETEVPTPENPMPVELYFKGKPYKASASATAFGGTGGSGIGSPVIVSYSDHGSYVSGFTSDITGTSDTAVIAAQGAGVRIYVTHILVTNSHASTGTFVNIKNGSTTIYTGYAAAGGGGFSATLPVPLRLSANTALNAACATTASNVRVSASGFKGS